jgi:hypothetical protein
VQALQIWISGANKGLSSLIKKPKIWFLTRIYLLKDATFTRERTQTAGIQAGISSTALSPVGRSIISPSIDFGHSNNSSSQTLTNGWLVWAAQYIALDYRVGSRSGPVKIKLLYNVVSEGVAYHCAPAWASGLTVEVSKQSDNLAGGAESASTCDDEDYQEVDDSF